MFKFLHEYNLWRKEHRQEVQEARIRKQLLKQPLNYLMLEQFLTAFIDKNQQDAVLELEGQGFKVKFYFDDSGNIRRKTTTEQILEQYRGQIQ